MSSLSTCRQLWTFQHRGVCCRHPQVFVRQGRVVRQRRHASGDRGEQMPNEMSVEVSLGAKLAQAEGEVLSCT